MGPLFFVSLQGKMNENQMAETSDIMQQFRSHFQEDLEEEVLVLDETGTDKSWSLVVWNDDVNTFDWVAESLVEVCDHSPEQAEQCAIIIHYNGRYAVRNGSFEKMRPMCEALLDRGITASVDQL